MDVIFLDIDGVLVNRKSLMLAKDKESFNEIAWWSNQIDPYAMGLLNKVIEETGALVVVSSTWRIGKNRTRLQEILKDAGFEGKVLGMTPRLSPEKGCASPERGKEIAEWLRTSPRPIDNFVILDDDSDMGALMHKLVKTTFEIGLMESHMKKAIAMLKGG